MPTTPIAPPTGMIIGNTAGNVHMTGTPRNAPHTPTATIAIT